MLRQWVLAQLEAAKDCSLVIVRDPLGLTQGMNNDLNAWGKEHAFTVIPFATNLLFRWKYELARADKSEQAAKLLLLDQTPQRRRRAKSLQVAAAPFYPDLLARTPPEARLDLDLRQFLRETTGDPEWPAESNDPQYARLIMRSLNGVLRAHANLRTAHAGRFTDNDFKTLVAYAALGVPEVAFKKPGPEDYWRIGLLGHEALAELDDLVPEVTRPIRDELAKAPAPFRWFVQRDPELVTRAFYLAVVLAQHTEQWGLLLGNIDPELASLRDISRQILSETAPKLVALDSDRAERDLQAVEDSLDAKALQLILLDQLRLDAPGNWAACLERERYSVLVRSLALLFALDDVLAGSPAAPAAAAASLYGSQAEQARVARLLFAQAASEANGFIDRRSSTTWSQLRDAYRLASDLRAIQADLAAVLKKLKVLAAPQLTFGMFREWWNDRRINRLEYYLSTLERLVGSGVLLPRREDELPPAFVAARDRVRARVQQIGQDIRQGLDELNRRFQDLVALQYPKWVADDTDVYLTSHFLRRCLKANWDPKTERAVLFIFDGMRYDIWDELLRPLLADQMEVLSDLPASSLLPSETHITRKAISAGLCPDQFDSRAGEDSLLSAALAREFALAPKVEVVTPESAGTGETVRYRAGSLDVYIFELCDKELHKITLRTLPDGREVPSRPLGFIYQQHIKNVLDTEVAAILRGLQPGTKVFITADHGFGPVDREPLWFEASDLNEPEDCSYRNCRLRSAVDKARLPVKLRDNIVVFKPQQLRMPVEESRVQQRTGQTIEKTYGAIAFPRVGYSFSRAGSPYKPDAYTHGGISLQELMIPMIVLRVKARNEGLLTLGAITGPDEIIEGEEAEYRMTLSRDVIAGQWTDELRVDVEASYARNPENSTLPHQVVYVPIAGSEVAYSFTPNPDDASIEERRAGLMRRTLTVTVSYRDGRRVIRKSQTFNFEVRLNTERIVRRVGSLGSILGLMPKGAKG